MGYYIIAERELVLGFRLVGVSGAIANRREDALRAFNQVINRSSNSSVKDVQILIFSETVSSLLEDEVTKHQLSGNIPLIVEIPDLSSNGHRKMSISDMIRNAMGIGI